jgi:hypothetical protein
MLPALTLDVPPTGCEKQCRAYLDPLLVKLGSEGQERTVACNCLLIAATQSANSVALFWQPDMPNVRVCRDKPARCEGVQVSNSEGLANHAGPESCASLGNGVREALTGECAGRVLSPEIGQFGCRRAPNTRKATAGTPLRRGVHAPGGVEDPWHARKHRERDPGAPASGLAHRSKARTVNRKATTVRYGRRESDSSIGPAKRPNNGTYEL